MSTLGVVAEVLREVAPRALRARQIAELAGGRLCARTLSKTPETVISRDLSLDVKKRGAASRFLRAGRGEFVLKEALPTAFFNDNGAYAAAWTRNLIAAGEIAAGVVDERSIRDLRPADVASYRQCHFFSGVGTWSRALRDAGWPDSVNVWSGSCPCVPWSSAGRKQGFSSEQHLWPEWFRLIAACRPAWIFGEQVSSKDGLAWLDAVRADLEGADYTLRVLDIPAACCGAPHRRQRLYFAAYARERTDEITGAAWLRERSADSRITANARESGCEIIGVSWLHAQVRPGDDSIGRRTLDSRGMGDSCCSRGGGNAGEVLGAQEAGEGERIAAGDLADEPGSPGQAHGGRGLGGSTLGDGGSILEDGGCILEDGGSILEDGGCILEDGGSILEDGGCILEDGGSITENGGSALGEIGLVRGATNVAGDGPVGSSSFRAGDRIRFRSDPTWGGAVRGYWAQDVEWIYCRPSAGNQDGCWRPTRSGIEPLAHGTATGMGRTRSKRLTGYGNAIVGPLATAFVGAVIDSIVEASCTAHEVAPEAPNTDDVTGSDVATSCGAHEVAHGALNTDRATATASAIAGEVI